MAHIFERYGSKSFTQLVFRDRPGMLNSQDFEQM